MPARPTRPSCPELDANREHGKQRKNPQRGLEPAGPRNRCRLRSRGENTAWNLGWCLSLERPRPRERPRAAELTVLKEDIVRTFGQRKCACRGLGRVHSVVLHDQSAVYVQTRAVVRGEPERVRSGVLGVDVAGPLNAEDGGRPRAPSLEDLRDRDLAIDRDGGWRSTQIRVGKVLAAKPFAGS